MRLYLQVSFEVGHKVSLALEHAGDIANRHLPDTFRWGDLFLGHSEKENVKIETRIKNDRK